MDLGTCMEADWVVGLGEVPDAGPAVVCLLPLKGRLHGWPTPPGLGVSGCSCWPRGNVTSIDAMAR